MEGFLIFIGIVILILLIIGIANIKIIPQSKAYVVERLGKYSATWETGGLKIKIPFIERIAKIVSLKEQVVDFAPQAVITKDNVTMKIDTVVFFQIINTKIRSILDEATDPWGIKVNRVELKNILPPKEIQDSMEKQMKAERERREAILRAEGDKQSRILEAQGFKESKILEAEAEKQSAILRAEAVREQKIREADGEAQAILKIKQAEADGIRMIKEADPSDAVVKIKSLEAFAKAADGQSTKIIIPSEIQSLAGLATGLDGVLKK